ncbi:MAG: hypothetical protein Q9221_004920 [Calogaya cf. arnoldii]
MARTDSTRTSLEQPNVIYFSSTAHGSSHEHPPFCKPISLSTHSTLHDKRSTPQTSPRLGRIPFVLHLRRNQASASAKEKVKRGMAGRKESVAEEHVTSVLAQSDTPIYDPGLTADDEVLVALGYKSELRREFSLWTSFCVSFAVLGLLPSFASTLYYGMGYAGTPGMTWGWLIAMIFIQCVAMSMAELCSAMPTSGGLYYAAAVMAPPGWGPLTAWITGWSNWMVQITGAPSVDYGMASMILAAVSITNPTFVPQNYQVFLLTIFIMVIQSFISSIPTKWIANFNSVGSTFNIIALAIVLITIPAATIRADQGMPKFNPSKEVWGSFYEGTSYPNGVAMLMSFVAVIWTMSGYDAPFHLSEECSNANIASPRAIVLTSGVGGLFGWFLQLVVAYTVVDINAALESELGQPYAAYLLQILPQNVTLAILALTIMCSFSMGQGCMVAASRVTFAYSRDDCFGPLSRITKRVNRHTRTPVNAVWFNTLVGIAMTILILGGELAAGALFSIGAVAAFVAFTIPIFIRVFFVGDRFRAGPWNLGNFSRPIGAMACGFVLLMVPILMLPSETGSELESVLSIYLCCLLLMEISAAGMNWTCLVYGGPMIFILIWWRVSARKWFKGPKVNIEHQMLGRSEAAIDGIAHEGDKPSSGSSTKDDNGVDVDKVARLA